MEIVKLESPELQVIEKSKAKQIKATFEPMVKMLAEFEEVYNSVISEADQEITQEITIKAKRLRIDIAHIRIDAEKVRKEQKEEYLRAGKAIDGVANILKWAIQDKENKLKDIEDHFENQERGRFERLQSERAAKLYVYVEDAHERKLAEMDEDVWIAYFNAKKKDHQDRIAAEQKAEIDRIAKEKEEEAERERIRIENEKLKNEAKKREAEAKKERERHQKIQAKLDMEAKESRLKHEAQLRIEADKREKLEDEIKAKNEAERIESERIETERVKKLKEEENRIQAELDKGDAEKVFDLILDLETLQSKYSFKSAKNKKMYKDVNNRLQTIINYI